MPPGLAGRNNCIFKHIITYFQYLIPYEKVQYILNNPPRLCQTPLPMDINYIHGHVFMEEDSKTTSSNFTLRIIAAVEDLLLTIMYRFTVI